MRRVLMWAGVLALLALLAFAIISANAPEGSSYREAWDTWVTGLKNAWESLPG